MYYYAQARLPAIELIMCMQHQLRLYLFQPTGSHTCQSSS
jgi:hypothetical protein